MGLVWWSNWGLHVVCFWITVLLTEVSEFGGKKKEKCFEMLSWECPLWSCARKPILECLCSWENSAQMWQQKQWCLSHSYKALPWGSTTWVGMNGTKVHFNQWNYADMLWIKQRNLGLYWCLQGWPWGNAVPGELKRLTWFSMASVTRLMSESEQIHAWLWSLGMAHGCMKFSRHMWALELNWNWSSELLFAYIQHNMHTYVYTHKYFKKLESYIGIIKPNGKSTKLIIWLDNEW